MIYLIDTNIIIRFLVGDHDEHLKIATDIFKKIEDGEYLVEILDSVMMEVFFVLTKFYKLPKDEVIDDLKKIVALRGVVGDRVILFETLNTLKKKNIDFVDAIICAKTNLQGFGKLSFDKDIEKC